MARLNRMTWLQLDRIGIALSGLCMVHCVLTLVLIGALGFGSSFFFAHEIHEIGLLVAVIVAGVAIGMGAIKHRKAAPFVTAMTGLSFMGGALATQHGAGEAILTVIGVTLVTIGHILNLHLSR